MTHRVETLLVDGEQFAMRLSCRYPDGTLVASTLFAEVRNGRIWREFEMDCWDE
jgi:hypothetical protein